LRLAIRKTLAADRKLRSEIQSMLERAGGVTQKVHAARDAYTAGHDQTIINNFAGASGSPTVGLEPPPSTPHSIDRHVPTVHGQLPPRGGSTRAARLTPRVAAKPPRST
jgi:hypothetical protein